MHHQDTFFYRFGKFIYRWRWGVVFVWIILLGVCIPFVPHFMTPFKSIGFVAPNSQSAKADKVLNKKLGYGYNRFIVIYSSHQFSTKDPKFFSEIKTSLSGLKNFYIKNKIIYPDQNSKQISKDKHTAYAAILFDSKNEVDHQMLSKLKSTIKKPPNLKMQIGGEPIFLDDAKKQTQTDLFRAEYIATPVAIITMLLVFGSVVAAALPIVLSGLGALCILMILYCLGHTIDLSVFTLNIALLLGLCLSLDYALFIISRFRDELAQKHAIDEAVAMTQATAGKAVFFSGLAVFASLSALTLFPINILFSVGIGGLTAVCISVLIAIILLPAILGIIKTRINFMQIPWFFNHGTHVGGNGYWQWLATKVIRRPLLFFFSILALLLCLAYPFFASIHVGVSDFRILPKDLPSRQVFDVFKAKFGENELAPIIVLIKTPHGNILSSNNISHLYDFTHKLKKDSRVEDVNSIVTVKSTITKNQYQTMYSHPDQLPKSLKDFLKLNTKGNLTTITVLSKYPDNSAPLKALINDIRQKHPGNGMTLQVTGTSVNTVDVFNTIKETFPYAFLWIVGFTYFILLFLLRSVVLPLKAILMTILSLSASYGALVLIIQHGWFHHILHFDPQKIIDINLMIIIFCTLFGISMDYEVFLLTRIKECYERTGNNLKSIVFGIDQSSKIITSAAIIVIVICFAFMSADILIVKAFGLGIAVAAFIDAFLIRTILVPATMALLKDWNWYLPKWLKKRLPQVPFDPKHIH